MLYICSVMRKKEIKKFKELVNAHNEEVASLLEEFKDFCKKKSSNPDILDSRCIALMCIYIIQYGNCRYDAYYDDKKDYNTSVNYLYETKQRLLKDVETYKKDAIEYFKRVDGNKEKLNAFENNTPLFFTLTDITYENGGKLYCMCYEFKKAGDGVFNAYIFDGEERDGHIMEISYLDWSLEKMTEKEFEEHYIMDRLKRKEFCRENDAIEYDNELRRLFHGQRDAI